MESDLFTGHDIDELYEFEQQSLSAGATSSSGNTLNLYPDGTVVIPRFHLVLLIPFRKFLS
jgi:hypothetical protein